MALCVSGVEEHNTKQQSALLSKLNSSIVERQATSTKLVRVRSSTRNQKSSVKVVEVEEESDRDSILEYLLYQLNSESTHNPLEVILMVYPQQWNWIQGQLCLVVVEEGRSLFDQGWLSSIKLNWCEIHHVQELTLESVLSRHTEVFQCALGTLKGY